jgi:hypothetical protein
MDAVPRGGSDLEQIQELLATAEGYTVFEEEGRRVGAFIELVAHPRGELIAIRHEGIFLWRRRVLPITTVANVLPEQRAVFLNPDWRLLADRRRAPKPVPDRPLPTREGAEFAEAWQQRMARYVSAAEGGTVQSSADEARPSAKTTAAEQSVTAAAPQASAEPAESDQASAGGYLLFVSTSRGYTLVEREGHPPSLGQLVEVHGQAGSFLVAKLAPSPLPNDRRICAYLAPSH